MILYVLNPLPLSRKQKPDLCSAGCVQMACDRRGIQYGHGLEDIAVKLKIHINEKYKDMFGPDLRRTALPDGHPEIGLLFNNFKDPSIQKLIKKYLELETQVYHPSQIGDEEALGKFIAEHIRADNDIIMNYWLSDFNQRPDGHYASPFAFDEETNETYAADPSPFSQEYWKENHSKLVRAMLPIWPEPDGNSRERGLIILSGPNYRSKESPRDVNKFMQKIEVYRPMWTNIEIFTEEQAKAEAKRRLSKSGSN